MAHIDVDALPYIDRDYDPSSSDPSVLSVSSAVNDLINQERQRVSKNETALHPSVGEEFALFKVCIYSFIINWIIKMNNLER